MSRVSLKWQSFWEEVKRNFFVQRAVNFLKVTADEEHGGCSPSTFAANQYILKYSEN